MKSFLFTIDNRNVQAFPGQSIMQAADEAGIYIPRLCSHFDLEPYGACRVCTVLVNGRPQTACTQPAKEGLVVENDTEQLLEVRRTIIDMLFVEGNHYCMFCEKSGMCELQALAYRFDIKVPQFPFQYPDRKIDASHPQIFIEHNRCILCARCVRASRDIDKKNIFDFTGRGPDKRIAVNAASNRAADTNVSAEDKAVAVCPVGTLMQKHNAFRTPIGQRQYDYTPIGTEISRGRRYPSINY